MPVEQNDEDRVDKEKGRDEAEDAKESENATKMDDQRGKDEGGEEAPIFCSWDEYMDRANDADQSNNEIETIEINTRLISSPALSWTSQVDYQT